MLKRKLNQVLSNVPPPSPPKPDFSAQQALREKIKAWANLPLAQFCRTRPDFDAKHGLVYKLLRTSKERLKDSTLCSHDTAFWLRNYQNSVSALWVIKLAGKSAGSVSRNQLLQWLRDRGEMSNMLQVHKWTKKWGFVDSEHTMTILASPTSVEEARIVYRESKTVIASKASRQALANKLLGELLKNTRKQPQENTEWGSDVYKLFKTLNKDLLTFQIMLGGMIKHQPLRAYFDELWELALKQQTANNIKIDTKLEETRERVQKLIRAGSPK